MKSGSIGHVPKTWTYCSAQWSGRPKPRGAAPLERGRHGRERHAKEGDEMKNVWKGLVSGGLTGMVGGLLLDGLDRGAHGVSALSTRVAQEAPGVAGHLRDSVTDAVTETA